MTVRQRMDLADDRAARRFAKSYGDPVALTPAATRLVTHRRKKAKPVFTQS